MNRSTKIAVIAAAATFAAASVCLAQAVGSSVTTAPAGGPITIESAPLVEQLLPYIQAIAFAIITGAIAAIAAFAKQKFGVDVDTGLRNSLEMAAKNSAAGLIAKGALLIEQNGKITMQPGMLADAVKDVVEKRAPDAVANFALKPEDISKKIIEQAALITAPTAPPETLTKPA